jgi:hypothetical protein
MKTWQTCSICNQPKDTEDFNFRDTKTDVRYKHCKECQKELRKESYLRNREYFLNYDKEHAPIRRKNRREFIINFKKGKPCADCDKIYPHYVMDFDHLPQFKKEIKIGQHGNYRSEEALLKEFAKCDLVCSNCHRIRTWNRK